MTHTVPDTPKFPFNACYCAPTMPMRSPMRSPWGPMRASGAPTAQDLSPNRRTLASHHWRRRAFQVVRASLDQSVCAHHWRRRASRVNARIVGGCLLAHHGPMLTIQMNLRPALNKLVMYVLFLAPPCHTVCKSKIWMATGNGLQIRSLFRPLQSLHADKSRSACLELWRHRKVDHVNHLITIVTSPLWRLHLSILVLKHFS